MIEAQQQIERFKEFITMHYEKDFHELIRKGAKSLLINFSELLQFDPELADNLLDDPEEVIKAAEIALTNFELPEKVLMKVRFYNLPESQKIKIRDIRSNNLNDFLKIEGIVRQASDVRPQVTSAKFECPSCGNNMTILQIDTRFKEPFRCSCGRKGKFRLISKELVDVQRLVLEESPEALEGGEQPKRLTVFLKDDLVEPRMEKKTTPGSKVRVTGVIKEVPLVLKSGTQSTRYDLMMDSNFIEPAEEIFEEIEVNKEEEEQIKALAKDPKIYEKLIKSIAPSIYGHDDVKEALVLQLFGGVKKIKSDGTKIRGDLHILLIGDPGSGKSATLQFITKAAPKARFVSGKGASAVGLCIAPDSLITTNPGGISPIQSIVESQLEKNIKPYCEGIWCARDPRNDKKIFTLDSHFKVKSRKINQFWKIKSPKYMVNITTSSGKNIVMTPNTKLFSIRDGCTIWEEADKVMTEDYLAACREFTFENPNKQLVIMLIKSNPIVYGVKNDVQIMIKKICTTKNMTIRDLAKKLIINENKLYHHWVKEEARGNIHLKDLFILAELSQYDKDHLAQSIKLLSLRKGHKIKIPSYLNEEFMYLAGLIAGDGDIDFKKNRGVIRLSNNSEEIQDTFKKIVHTLFGVQCCVSSERSEKRAESWRFGSKIIAEILNSLGIAYSPKSHKIDMSNKLLTLPNHLLKHFLSGYFDADGGPVESNKSIEVSSASKYFVKKLQLVLLRFGIQSKLRTRSRKNKKSIRKDGKIIVARYDKAVLTIYGRRNLELFRERIGFTMTEKRKRLESIIASLSKYDTNTDVVPGAEKLLKKITKKHKISSKALFGYKTSNYTSGKFRVSTANLRKIVSKLNALLQTSDENFLQLQLLANADIVWEKIIMKKKIYNHNYPFVYDLTVADSHNFLVNGIVVHNTASIVKDEFLRGWALEAGAMVLANKGIAIVDELDKMTSEDRDALHEALEQQQVTIAKANINATLNAETTVLAAANPKLGRFDPYQPIAAQIDLPPTLINRFDLIFPIRDIPNKEMDTKIASHILKLQQKPEELKQEIETPVLKKYISYAKQKVFPVLTDAAIDEIKNFYVTLRNKGSTGDETIKPIPISARQLEALVRLSEGSARVRLSPKVIREDAKRAIALLQHCLMQVGFDYETGQIDIDRIATGVPASERSRISVLREIINSLESKGMKAIPLEEITSKAAEKGVTEEQVEEIIERLKRDGTVFEPRRGFISKI